MDSKSARPPATVVFAFLDFNDGGAQRLALRTCQHLDAARFRARLLCVRGRGSLVAAAEAAGVSVDVLGRLRRRHDFGAVVRLARYFRSVGADVVDVPLYSRASPYVRLAAKLAAVPLTVAHEHCRATPPTSARRWVDRLLAPGTRFVAVSAADRAALIAAGVAPSAVDVVYPGIDLDHFAPADRSAARASLGLPADRPIVLVPARLHPMKRHVDLLAALPSLRARLPGVLVLCAGDGPLAPVLPALARAAGLSEHVRFLGRRDDMPALFAAADVVALSSAVEGLPAVLIEAQAAERCVVATDVGGVRDVVADGDTGRLVPSGHPAALAGALADVLADPPGRAAMAERARRAANARFGIAAGTRRLEAIYASELARRGRAVPATPLGRPDGRGGAAGHGVVRCNVFMPNNGTAAAARSAGAGHGTGPG